MSDVTVQYVGGEPNEFRKDAAWYCEGTGATLVAVVQGGGRTISVYCAGQMRILNNETGEYLRTASDLAAACFTEDAELNLIDEGYGPYEWVNNVWFELDENDRSLDVHAHELDGIIQEARAIIAQEEAA
jgi:hypothetical protein